MLRSLLLLFLLLASLVHATSATPASNPSAAPASSTSATSKTPVTVGPASQKRPATKSPPPWSPTTPTASIKGEQAVHEELFDLQTDPLEKTNLTKDLTHSETLALFRQQTQAHVTQARGDYRTPVSTVPLPAEAKSKEPKAPAFGSRNPGLLSSTIII